MFIHIILKPHLHLFGPHRNYRVGGSTNRAVGVRYFLQVVVKVGLVVHASLFFVVAASP